MSEKALLLVKEEIIRTVQENYSEVSYDEASKLAEDLIEKIDWDDSALMHKGISWITKSYLNSLKTNA